MELTTTRPCERFPDASGVTREELDGAPDDTVLEGYDCTAGEPNLAPVVFDERIDLKTRIYAALIGVMSFGGIGWICLCIGAGLNFLFS